MRTQITFIVIVLALVILFLSLNKSSGQSILNGDFENTIATADSINMTNEAFNAAMKDVFSFGSWEGGGALGGDPDIITSNDYCNYAENGKWYVALTGGGTDAIALKLSSPLVTGNKYILNFWDEACNFQSYAIKIGVSANDSTFGDSVYTAPICVDGSWTLRSDTFTAPDSGLYITVEGTGDIGSWGQIDNFSLRPVSPPPTSLFSISPVTCLNQSATVTYTGSADSSAVYAWNFGSGVILSGSGKGPYSIEWPVSGMQYVSLQVTDSGGTSGITSDSITVNDIPTSTFTSASIENAGETDLVTYTGNAIGGALFSWNFDGAIIDSGTVSGPYKISFRTPGNYAISLTVTQNGCSSNLNQQTVGITNPLIATSPICVDSICTVSYTGAASSLGVYNWNFSNAQVISGSGSGPYTIKWNKAGIYSMSLSVMINNNLYSFTDTVNVLGPSAVLCGNDSSSGINSGINVIPNNITDAVLYPNPVLDEVKISITTLLSETVVIQVCDEVGRLLISQSKKIVNGNNIVQLNMAKLPAAGYFIVVKEQSGYVKVLKFIKVQS